MYRTPNPSKLDSYGGVLRERLQRRWFQQVLATFRSINTALRGRVLLQAVFVVQGTLLTDFQLKLAKNVGHGMTILDTKGYLTLDMKAAMGEGTNYGVGGNTWTPPGSWEIVLSAANSEENLGYRERAWQCKSVSDVTLMYSKVLGGRYIELDNASMARGPGGEDDGTGCSYRAMDVDA
ncbi:hypothetical protein EDC04DRAFT_2602454 [Pisolithus marmoratus]|nr:hypothetical protein EDC04DRAFT_2602454 [Pisolithus marmoratus]